jgi:hypothetical protein
MDNGPRVGWEECHRSSGGDEEWRSDQKLEHSPRVEHEESLKSKKRKGLAQKIGFSDGSKLTRRPTLTAESSEALR